MRGVLLLPALMGMAIVLPATRVAHSQTRQVAVWGANDCGQGTLPPDNRDFVAVAGGNAHSLGLRADGTIIAWGFNECGQCDVPAPNSGFVAVAAGGNHSLGLKTDGTIVAWGCNDDGQCNVPAPNENFVALAGGGAHSLGLKVDGTIVAWGYNDFGQCNVPDPNADFSGLAAGWDHSLALKGDGAIVAWGYNGDGECDVPSPNLDFVGLAGGGAHSLGLRSDGTIVAWGDSASGQCDVPVPNGGFVSVAAGVAHSLGLKADGTILAWGANEYRQREVSLPNADFVAVAGGAVHSLGVKSRAKLFVSQAATGANEGSSWADAYQDLQSALIPASSGTSIWVAAGTYKPTAGSDRTVSFELKDGVALYGGFEGTETVAEERDWGANETILSGDIGVPADSTDNSYHVVVGSGTDSTAVLDGFVVTGGRGGDGHPEDGGGGLYNDSGSPTIGNVRFLRNSSRIGGGAYNGAASDPVLVNVTFSHNRADSGAGMFNRGGATPRLSNVTFSGNVAGSFGGAMCNIGSSPGLVNAVLWGDSAMTGGEIWNDPGSTPAISYSLVEGSGGSGPGWNGSGGGDGGNNIDTNPLFVDQSGGNLRLSRSSAAVNAGYNFAPNLGATDLDGEARIVWGVVDMGAYEYQGLIGPVIYVDDSATGNNSGSSWADAFTDLQGALGAAIPGDFVWVAAGTYKPTAGSDRTVSFELKDGVALYGGFEGTETVAEERDWGANETILSGDIGVPADSTDNSYHVVVGSGTDSTAVLDGFTITAGAAADDTLGGGGMIIWPGSPTISNTVFSGNTASTGGGLYARGEGSRPTLVNVTFTGNSANDSGGGLTNDDSSKVMVVNAVFSGNSAGNAGGAMHSQRHAGATLTNVTFSGNTAGAGGAISNDESLLSLINTILWGNTAALGSEIWNHPAGMPVISYSLIESSGGSGGGWNAALGTDGGDNIDADPSFVDQASGNLRLTSGSPAIDAGTAAAPDLPETDRDGNSRISGFSVDMGAYESALVVTGIEEHDRLQPFRIVSAAPNPFNPSTTIHFTLPNAMPVTAEVWSVTGALVRVLATNKPSPAGDNELVWAGRNDNGSPVASGVYFIRIATGLGSRTARVVLLK